jgi:peptidoglycan-associated lipoprotein
VTKRLKLFMFGPAGVGKTTAAIQFPNSYIIDAERGTENYDKLITASGSAVFQSSDMQEITQEVKALLTNKHEYRTLVIDPITTAYNDLLDKSELKVGSEFGRHYGEANKHMKRLANLIMALDMNVIVTAHAKYLNTNSNNKVRLEGHSDERGSREYNIGLGERRAQAVRRALMLQGVTEAQITTVSYGEERPSVQGSDESAYAKNRRVELVYGR